MARPIRGSRRTLAGIKGGFEGLQEAVDKLETVIDEVSGRELKQGYYEAGEILAHQVRNNAPRSKSRKTGTYLADGVFVNWGTEDAPNVLVGMNYGKVPHAHLVEYGSSRSAAQPYFRPAITQSYQRVGDHIKNTISRIIAKATK